MMAGLVASTSWACAGASHVHNASTVAAAAAPPSAPDEAFRRQAPEPEPPLHFVPPAGKLTTLANGMGVLVIERHWTRMVAANLIVRGGTTGLPGETPAAVALFADSLMTGTPTRTEHDIYGVMSQKLVDLDVRCGSLACRFSLGGLASSFDVALEVLSDFVLRPTFVEAQVEMKRKRLVGRVAHEGDDTVLIGHRAVHAAIFGPDHPFTRVTQTIGPGLEKLTRDDVMRVWRESMDPKRAVLIVAGDVEQSAVVARAEALFGSWKADGAVRPRPPIPPASPLGARIVVVDRPKAPQAMILYATSVAPVGTPDYYADLLVHRLLGGMRSSGFGGLRNEDAIWNGRGHLEEGRRPGIFWWETNVARDRAAEVLTALASRIRDLHEHGPSADELVAVKGFVTRSLPRSLETVRSVADTFTGLAQLELPVDYLDAFRTRIGETSPEAVRAAVPDPAAMKAVVVGDLATLRAPLLALGWGPIDECDAEGNVLRRVSP